MNIILSDRIYLPSKIVDKEILKDEYLKPMYNEAKCDKCPYRSDRHSEYCDECPGYLGIFKLYNEKKKDGEKYYGISVGNKEKYKEVIKKKYKNKKIKIVDKRSAPKFSHKIKLTGELYPKQVGPVKKMTRKGYGVLLSPPRSGKTLMMTAVAINKKKRTLILAAQSDWLDGFYETICGSDTQKALTNIPKLEKKYGYKICVYGKRLSDFTNKKHDIVLATYQTFITPKGQKKLKKILKGFGTIILDECDMSPAEAFSKVVNSFKSRYRMGCTGTNDRKDGKYFIVDHIIGPVTAKSKIKPLTASVEMVETGIRIDHNYKVLAYAYRALADKKERNNLIVKWIKHDIKNGRSITIPVATVKHCKELVRLINKKCGKGTAAAFTRAELVNTQQRKQFIQDARNYDIKVVVGIRKMLQRGINVPRWDTLYEITPISNIPNHSQEVSRILTPHNAKQSPLIRQFLDDFGFARGCLRTAIYRVYVPHKFRITKDNWNTVNKYLRQGPIVKRQITTPNGNKNVGRKHTPIKAF